MVLPDRFLSDEAIFFFDGNEIVKQMLYSEFEAVLDRVVGIPEFSGRHYKAAYVVIESVLNVHSIVLFEVIFDEEGQVPDSWNIPLRDLSKKGVNGPDFGGGTINIMTRRSCVDSYYKPMLWEPHSKQKGCLKRIYDSVRENRLGIYDGDSQRLREPARYDNTPLRDFHADGAELASDQRINSVENIQSMLSHKYEKKIFSLKDEHQKAITDLEQQHREQIEIVSDKYRAKFERELDWAREAFTGELDVKQLELHYSQESEKQLQQEIERAEASISDAQEHFLSQLMKSGIELVVSHIGSGVYNLESHQVKEYLENPTRFWAARQGVTEIHYEAWHNYQQNPVCQMGASTGCLCGIKLERINCAADFVIGESDMCAKHRRAKS